MLIENFNYNNPSTISGVLEENVFRYCKFSTFTYEGGSIDAVFLGCDFSDVDWYWGLFVACVFIRTRFEKCIFRGSSFPDCKFVECEFIECQFLQDNLGGNCSGGGAKMYGSTTKACIGMEFLFNEAAH
jgi:fluoroquinolone resistance protein